ncbi:MAG TPA: ATP-binding protein [Syntrophorhabdus sp.]|jgi:MinD superfamily P-loop ATPase|nr:ATP-binding protein [Pseudomonadota bacterium]HNS78070.1 ATP-binding protein [Syntrophorhabdus sp.]HOH26760.1 ATP-binding protein [Syntrophorhabdus sp.]HQH81470.1 ATP-binding protein [Syntrophorhabdus sp.]HQI95127.1 ATP-binding protein [Syntrophorhabdus sp.]
MNIAIASGKGGTGKTTIAVSLAYFLATSGQSVQYLDCDVEEPNGHLFLKPKIESRKTAYVMVPKIIEEKCTFCGECSSKCQYNALVSLPDIPPLVFPGLCHGCGLCVHICPENAIIEAKREVGFIEEGTGIEGIACIHGILNVGEVMAVPLIRQVKEGSLESRVHIIDAPPGTACPLVATISDADIVVMVTEPTPFGLHDLSIAVAVAEKLEIPLGLVINREREQFQPLEKYIDDHGMEILARIPEDRRIAEHYSRGEIIIEALPELRPLFSDLAINIGKAFGKSVIGV